MCALALATAGRSCPSLDVVSLCLPYNSTLLEGAHRSTMNQLHLIGTQSLKRNMGFAALAIGIRGTWLRAAKYASADVTQHTQQHMYSPASASDAGAYSDDTKEIRLAICKQACIERCMQESEWLCSYWTAMSARAVRAHAL